MVGDSVKGVMRSTIETVSEGLGNGVHCSRRGGFFENYLTPLLALDEVLDIEKAIPSRRTVLAVATAIAASEGDGHSSAVAR